MHVDKDVEVIREMEPRGGSERNTVESLHMLANTTALGFKRATFICPLT